MNFISLAAATETFLVKETVIMLVTVLIAAALGYFLGSINTAVLYSKLRYKKDIRDYGSGNAGMTNMLRTFGKGAAAITLLGDLGKTVIAILLTQLIAMGFGSLSDQLGMEYMNLAAYTAALFSITGHCFPIYYKMRGGKGVAAVAAAAAVLSPMAFVCLLILFVLMVWGFKYVSLASVICVMLYPVLLNRLYGPGISNIFALVIAALIVWRHRENIKRLWNGTENKISFKKKKKDDDGESGKDGK